MEREGEAWGERERHGENEGTSLGEGETDSMGRGVFMCATEKYGEKMVFV